MPTTEERIASLEERCKSNTYRINELKENTAAVQRLATSVELMAQSMDGMAAEQKAQGQRLTALERIPADRWNSATKTVITALASGLVGAFIGNVIK